MALVFAVVGCGGSDATEADPTAPSSGPASSTSGPTASTVPESTPTTMTPATTTIPPTTIPPTTATPTTVAPTTAPATTTTTPASPSTAAPEDGVVVVRIVDFAFDPPMIEVPAGTTVRWVNDDTFDHSVVADDGTFISETLATGDIFEFTFEAAGMFAYICGIHPSMLGMVTVT